MSRLGLAAVLLLIAVASASAQKAQKAAKPYAVIVGTVFYEESGRLLRGAKVEVKQKEGKKHWGAETNDEGGFAVRLPAGAGVYIVEAQAPGRQADRKEVEITGEERVDIVLHLKAR